MEFRLYTADFPENTRYLNDCFDGTNSSFEIKPSYFGSLININNIEHGELKKFLVQYLFDFYFKELVLSKIYDEYYYFNTNDASFVLSELSDSIAASFLGERIAELIDRSDSFNAESFVLFNMQSLMPRLYGMTDIAAARLISLNQRDNCISVLKTYKNLSFNRSENADVEFSSELECMISLDEAKPALVPAEEVIGFLLQNSPKKVSIKNAQYCPELAIIIEEIFDVSPIK